MGRAVVTLLLLAGLCEAQNTVSHDIANPALAAALQNPELGKALHELIVKETTARAQLTSEKEDLQKQLNKAKQKLANSAKTSARDRKLLSKSKAEQQDISAANTKLKLNLDKTAKDLVQSNKAVDKFAKELTTSNKELAKLRLDLSNSEQEVKAEKYTLDEQSVEHAKADANLVKELHQLNATNEALEHEEAKVSQEEKHEEIVDKIDQQKLNTEERTLISVEARRKSDEQQLKQEEGKLQSEDMALRQSRAMSSLKDKSLRQLGKSLREVRSELDTAETELHTLKTQVKKEEEEEKSLDSADVERLSTQLRLAKASMDSKDRELKSFRDKSAARDKELSQLRAVSAAKDQVLHAATNQVKQTLATLATDN